MPAKKTIRSRTAKKMAPKKKPSTKKPTGRGAGIRSDMSVNEVLTSHPETLAVFATVDLTCLGDREQQSMTVQAWAMDHGLTPTKFLIKLNASSKGRHKSGRKTPSHKGL